MSRPIKLIPRDTDMPIEEWHKKIIAIKSNEHKLKMLVIEKIMSNPNISVKEVKSIFFISTTRMNEWVKQYNENGLDGLKAKKIETRGSGKGNTKVADKYYEELRVEMNLNPDKKWTGKDKQSYIKKICGVEVTEASISYRMKRI